MPYKLAFGSCLLVPFISLAVVLTFRGLIRMDEKVGIASPTIIHSLFIASFGLALRVLLVYNLESYGNLLLPYIMVVSVFTIAVITIHKNIRATMPNFSAPDFAMGVVILAYSYAAIITVNSIFDQSKPTIFKTKIVSKRVFMSKTTNYYLVLSPWANYETNSEMHVSKDTYYQLNANDSISIQLHKGYLNIHWYQLL